MSYEVKIDAFEGPIDLLLHLLDENEVEIYDIQISEITEQYLDYIAQMKELDLDVASEFLIMAARLMEIKAQTLLPSKEPTEDEEETKTDPRQQLVDRLVEYKKFKDLASKLQNFAEEQRSSYTRNVAPLLGQLEFAETNALEDVTLDEFTSALQDVLQAQAARQEETELEDKDQDEQKISHLEAEEVTIKEQQGYIVERLLNNESQISFRQVFSDLDSRLEIVVTFMALLELIKLKEVRIEQPTNFAEIKIYYTGSGS
ncbi:segregation and condensation protein A [Halanaerobaculum tunisiense]